MEAWYPGDVNANDIRGGYNGALKNGTTISGLVVNRFTSRGIAFSGFGGNTVEGCFIGTDASAKGVLPNHGGVFVFRDTADTA